jgi:hypothetical protein
MKKNEAFDEQTQKKAYDRKVKELATKKYQDDQMAEKL